MTMGAGISWESNALVGSASFEVRQEGTLVIQSDAPLQQDSIELQFIRVGKSR